MIFVFSFSEFHVFFFYSICCCLSLFFDKQRFHAYFMEEIYSWMIISAGSPLFLSGIVYIYFSFLFYIMTYFLGSYCIVLLVCNRGFYSLYIQFAPFAILICLYAFAVEGNICYAIHLSNFEGYDCKLG